MVTKQWLTCSTCGNQYDPDNPRETHRYRHPINGPVVDSTKADKKEPNSGSKTVAQLPTDPVLRATLIRLGVLKPTDLTQTEQELAATGMVQADIPEPDIDSERIVDGVGRHVGWLARTTDEESHTA